MLSRLRHIPWLFPALVLAMGGCLAGLHWTAKQDTPYLLLAWTTLAFVFYALLLKSTCNAGQLLVAAAFCRMILWPGFPSLSDDIYRFYWDGLLTVSGHSPYGIMPGDALSMGIPGLTENLFSRLNSPSYYTVYPPVTQIYYAIAAVAPTVSGAAVILRIQLTATELAGLWFVIQTLRKLEKPVGLAALFFLNPLVLTECTGNVHFEAAMLSFTAIAWFYCQKGNVYRAALFFALAVGIKLLPLLLLPWFWWSSRPQQRWPFFGMLVLSLLLIFLPVIWSNGLPGLGSSVGLYFQSFEFNASVYFLIRGLLYTITGYNMIQWIGPLLGMFTFGGIIWLAGRYSGLQESRFGAFAVLSWGLYLLLSTTVHPWYVTAPLFFCLYRPFLFPVVWSFTAFFSYTFYQPGQEGQWSLWTIAEYGLVLAAMMWDSTAGRHTRSKSAITTPLS